MKLIANIVALAACMVALASCQETRTVKITVVEEDGTTPVAGARVAVFYLSYDTGKDRKVAGFTDEKGAFVAKGHAPLRMEALIEKPGYYKTKSGRLSRKMDHDMIFVLRRIRNPIPMYAKRIDIIPPKPEKWFGYDLLSGDWVHPYGRGKTADFLMKTRVLREKDEFEDFHHEFKVKFPNRFDGFVVVPRMENSVFKSPYLAPEDAEYMDSRTIYINRSPGGARRTNNEPNRCCVLRLRTRVDEKGNIISCHYAKIYGDFLDFACYFNPATNDRNLEFDPDRNLFKNLKTGEHVSDP